MKAVLFDLDETLHDRTASLALYIQEHHTRLAFADSIDLENYQARFIELDNGGYTDKNALFESLVCEFGLKIEPDELLLDFRTNLGKKCVLFPEVEVTLQSLRERGLKIGIVTNGTQLMQNTKLEAAGLLGIMDVVLISEREGYKKPSPEIFLSAARQLKVAPEECLFVGDNPQNDIWGAHNVGMKTAWLRGKQEWPTTLDFMPDRTLNSLSQVLDCSFV